MTEPVLVITIGPMVSLLIPGILMCFGSGLPLEFDPLWWGSFTRV